MNFFLRKCLGLVPKIDTPPVQAQKLRLALLPREPTFSFHHGHGKDSSSQELSNAPSNVHIEQNLQKKKNHTKQTVYLEYITVARVARYGNTIQYIRIIYSQSWLAVANNLHLHLRSSSALGLLLLPGVDQPLVNARALNTKRPERKDRGDKIPSLITSDTCRSGYNH